MRKVSQQGGEKVVEEMSTLDALDCLGVCPANLEWFELNASRLFFVERQQCVFACVVRDTSQC